jgi:hypothetical protein
MIIVIGRSVFSVNQSLMGKEGSYCDWQAGF